MSSKSEENYSVISKMHVWEFPGALVVRIQRFHCCDPGPVPGQGTEIPQAAWHGQN